MSIPNLSDPPYLQLNPNEQSPGTPPQLIRQSNRSQSPLLCKEEMKHQDVNIKDSYTYYYNGNGLRHEE